MSCAMRVKANVISEMHMVHKNVDCDANCKDIYSTQQQELYVEHVQKIKPGCSSILTACGWKNTS